MTRGPPFTALSRQGGYAHYFYTNLVGTLRMGTAKVLFPRGCEFEARHEKPEHLHHKAFGLRQQFSHQTSCNRILARFLLSDHSQKALTYSVVRFVQSPL